MDEKLDSAWWLAAVHGDFYGEMAKLAAQVNVGQWWEQVGGPHLARGGSLKDFQRMMNEEGIPAGAQRRFMRTAETRYAQNRKDAAQEAARKAGGYSSGSRRSGPSGWGGVYDVHEEVENMRRRARSKAVARAGVAGLGMAAGVGGGLYAAFGKQKAKATDGPSKSEAQMAMAAAAALPASYTGASLGSEFGPKGMAIGAALGAALGGGIGLLSSTQLDSDAKYQARIALRSKNLDKQEKKLRRRAQMGSAAHARKLLPVGALYGTTDMRDAGGFLGAAGAGMGSAALAGVAQRYTDTKAYEHFRKARGKKGFSKAASVKEAVRSPYMLNQVGKSKVKKLAAEAPNPKYRVKTAAPSSFTPQEQSKMKNLSALHSLYGDGKDWLPKNMPKSAPQQAAELSSIWRKKRAAKGSAQARLNAQERALYSRAADFDPWEKKAMFPSAGIGVKGVQKAAKKLSASQKIGVPDMNIEPLNKLSFAQSQYNSGPMSQPPAVYASHIPPFRNPQMKTGGPPSEKKKDGEKYASMRTELAKLSNVISAKGALTAAKKIGLPKTSAPPGPSIQQVSKPVGFGRALAGATKTL